ncbi:YceI family protein [Amycolatopsis circi]|uniref:YceI family protein n=1 Tax=Amycolatopsis circi TaxID=871959 RepID=UPI000E225EB8|nr:YceI family protein [Amycolatopsis circi]
MTSATTYAHLTGTYTIDGSHSRIGFVARHAMVTKVRGSFNEFEGSFTLDGENPANSSANITIQSKSVDTRNADRDGHLRNNDFLSCDEFPTISFTSTGIAQTGEDTFDVTGDLTIKDVTKSVTVPFEFGGSAKDPFGNDRVGFEGSTSINRSDYNVKFNAALETGGVLVSDKITLEFEISAIKNA